MTSENDVARANRELRHAMRLRPGEPSVWASFLGSIPAEETDEEFAAAIEGWIAQCKKTEGSPRIQATATWCSRNGYEPPSPA